jgi:hypothetical protein
MGDHHKEREPGMLPDPADISAETWLELMAGAETEEGKEIALIFAINKMRDEMTWKR